MLGLTSSNRLNSISFMKLCLVHICLEFYHPIDGFFFFSLRDVKWPSALLASFDLKSILSDPG